MKRFIAVLIFFKSCISVLPNPTGYFGLNLMALPTNALELGYEFNIRPALTFKLYSGYLFNSRIDSPYKILTPYEFDRKAGIFIKPGIRLNLRSDPAKFAPFTGVNMVHSIAFEEGVYMDLPEPYLNEPFKSTTYNLGINGIMGITSPATKKINIDLGIQAGKIIIENLIDEFHSYMPGMGVNVNRGFRIQGILIVKYRIK